MSLVGQISESIMIRYEQVGSRVSPSPCIDSANPMFEFYYNAPLGSWKLVGNWMIDNNVFVLFQEDCEEVWRELMRL